MNDITTYIKEAFITKSNIENVRKSHNLPDYSDISFENPTDKDCFEFQNLLHKAGVMPYKKYPNIDGYECSGWCIAKQKIFEDEEDNEMCLVIRYRDLFFNSTRFDTVLVFNLNTRPFELIKFEDKDRNPRSQRKYPGLYEIGERIAEALGFCYWDDEYNGWLKNKR